MKVERSRKSKGDIKLKRGTGKEERIQRGSK